MNRETQIEGSDTLVLEDRPWRRRLIVGGAILLGLLALLYFSGILGGGGEEGAGTAQSAEDANAPNVTVVVPGQSDVARVITASGPLAARRDQPVGVSGSGGLIQRVYVEAGDWVGQGQLLARIERSVQSQQAAQLRASVNAAQADAALAKNELERAQALVERGFVSKADIDRKQAAYDAAVARVGVARAQLNATRAQIGLLDVRAPTSGLILERNVEVGQVVSAGSPALFRMARGGEMEVRASLSQQDLAAIKVGMAASVTPVGSDQSVQGRVWQVSPVIDPQNRQGEVRIAIPYTSSIRPGGFAEASIQSGTMTAPLLPQSAVLADANGSYVYVVGKDNKVERRDVKVGTVDDRGVTIAEGISGTEQIVERAGPFLNVGQKISPRRKAAQGQAAPAAEEGAEPETAEQEGN